MLAAQFPALSDCLPAYGPGNPLALICDNYRAPELHQAVGGRVRIIERARSGGEATSNIQSLRSLLLDTEAGVSESSRALLGAAWGQTNLVVGPDGLAKVTKLDERRSQGTMRRRRCYWPLANKPAVLPRSNCGAR